jgi:hypothetical protein
MRNLQVDGERLWASLMELAQIGATPKGGVCRLAASDLDGEARPSSSAGARTRAALFGSTRSATSSRAGPAGTRACRRS